LQLTLLRVRNLRCLVEVELRPDPRLSLIVGANGAGKSSLVEAVHVLGYGRSFRGRIRDGLVRSGAEALEVYAEWRDASGQAHRAGHPAWPSCARGSRW
jgi:DNA replication and repair protein RecF